MKNSPGQEPSNTTPQNLHTVEIKFSYDGIAQPGAPAESNVSPPAPPEGKASSATADQALPVATAAHSESAVVAVNKKGPRKTFYFTDAAIEGLVDLKYLLLKKHRYRVKSESALITLLIDMALEEVSDNQEGSRLLQRLRQLKK